MCPTQQPLTTYGSEAATSLCQLYRCRISEARCCLLMRSRADLITCQELEKNSDLALQPAECLSPTMLQHTGSQTQSCTQSLL